MLSSIDNRILYNKINNNIGLKQGPEKYIYSIYIYSYFGIKTLATTFFLLAKELFQIFITILFLPLVLLKALIGEKEDGVIFFLFRLSTTLLIFGLLFYFGIFYYFLTSNTNKNNTNFLLKLHQYRTAVSVRDKNGYFLGITPNSITVPNNYIDRNLKNGLYDKGYNRESSLYVNDVPDFFWKVLIEREHKELTFNDDDSLSGYFSGIKNKSFRGVDISAPLRKILNRIMRNSRGAGGGSTPMNVMVKNLYGYNYFESKKNRNHECPLLFSLHPTACRKFVEYRAARDLFPHLAKDNGAEFKRWVSMHAPFVGAVGGNGLYGLQAASAIMFGKKTDMLNMAEQSYLASNYLTDFRFSKSESILEHSEKKWKKVCKNNLTQWNRIERWECRKRVAKMFAVRIIKKTYQGNNQKNKLAQLNKDFNVMVRPKTPKIPRALNPFFAKDTLNNNDKIKKYANLRTRLNYILPGFKLLIKKELQDLIAKYPSTNPIEVIISLPIEADLTFRQNIQKSLNTIENKHSFYKHLPITTKKEQRASIRISVANLKTGATIRYYLQEGKHATEEKAGLSVSRPIASIAKIPLAMLLINNGLKTYTSLCNKYYNGLRNAGKDEGKKDCSHQYTFEESIGRSKNLPLRYALSENTTKNQLQRLFKDFGLKLDSKVSNKSNLIENLSFGRAKASAAQTHRIINMVSHLLVYPNKPTPPLHTIKKVTYVIYNNDLQPSIGKSTLTKRKNKLSKTSRYLKNKSAVKTMKVLLSSPVQKSYGTLHFLKSIENGEVIYGKSGTFDTTQYNIKDKYAVGLIKVKKEYYSFSILVGTEDYSGNGLIKSIKSEQLIKPLVQDIVNSIYFGETT